MESPYVEPPVIMQGPPVVQESGRNYLGWAALIILMFLTLLSALAESLSPTGKGATSHDEEQSLLKSTMQLEVRQKSSSSSTLKTTKDALDKNLKSMQSELANLSKQPKSDLMAVRLMVAFQTELHQTVSAKTLAPLLKSKTPSDHLLLQIYGSEKLNPAQAKDLGALLPEYPFVYEAAKVHALQKSGDTTAIARIVKPRNTATYAIAGFCALLGLSLSFAVWSSFFQKLKDGTLEILGLPMAKITMLDADRLAVRAAQIFGMYIVIETLVSFLPHIEVNLFLRTVLMLIFMVGGIVLLQKVPIDDKRLSLDMLGVSTRNLKKDILLGFQGFVAEFPIAIIFAAIGAAIFSFLPKASHPASEAIARDQSLKTVIPVIILGSILAPIWEELVFRGLLLPALNRLTGKLVPSILISSFLFASMHPQGISIWMSLASVGAASCLLSYKSRSMVPSMVMHCLHNTAIFALALMVQ